MPSAPQPVPINMSKIEIVSYSGNNGSNQAIAHTLKSKPRFIGISGAFFEIHPCTSIVQVKSQALGWIHTVTEATATHFYVGNSSRPAETANSSGTTYYAVVIG